MENTSNPHLDHNGSPKPRWVPKGAFVAKQGAGINADQALSLGAMIAYIAYQSGQSEFRIERNLADHFNVPNAKLLLAQDFDNAIRYLTATHSYKCL